MLPFFLLNFAGLRTFKKSIEDFWEVLEVAEIGEGRDVRGKGFRVMIVKPECGGVETFTVGFSGTADATEVADEFEGGEGVVRPSQLEPLKEGLRGSVRDHMEEEIKAGVT